MPNYRLLCTVSRTWPSFDAISNELTKAIMEFVRGPSVTVIHGGALRGDSMVHAWCEYTPMVGQVYVVEEIHRAAWKHQGKGAGMWRNRRMGDSGIDRCLAFIDLCRIPDCTREPGPHGTHGAAHCADYARRRGVPVQGFGRGWEVTKDAIR